MAKCVDLTGERFGKLVVLYKDINKKYLKHHSKVIWYCKCDCGNYSKVISAHLNNGHTKSCGSKKCNLKKLNVGDKCGFVTIKKIIWHNKKGIYVYQYLCVCGKLGYAPLYKTKDLKYKSCGCSGASYMGISGPYFWSKKRGAISRNFEFNITIRDIWDLYLKQNARCALSGIKLTMGRNRKNGMTASLDRIDSLKGYTIDNIQWVHKDVNKIKWDFDENKLFEYCKKIYYYNKDKYEVYQQ